jgi:hypothetical protein
MIFSCGRRDDMGTTYLTAPPKKNDLKNKLEILPVTFKI